MPRSAKRRRSGKESTSIETGSGAESGSTNTAAGAIDRARRAEEKTARIVAIVTAIVDGQDPAHDHHIASTAADEIALDHHAGGRIVATFAIETHTDDVIAHRRENNPTMLKPVRAQPIVSPPCKQRRHRSSSSGLSVFDNRKLRIERRKKSTRKTWTGDVATFRVCAGKPRTWI
jgi:hypothetical protein